ncbi:MAG: RHS repeat-associated core domain-containing protein [Myxococcales bacterium]
MTLPIRPSALLALAALLPCSVAEARYYDARVAVWLQPDRTQVSTFREGPNLYEYVGDMPTLRTDPKGETWADDLDFFVAWLSGSGPDVLVFEDPSPQVQDLSLASGVQSAIDYYYQKNGSALVCGGDNPPTQELTDYASSFGLSGLYNAGLNSTQQFVGSYRVDIFPNGDGTNTVVVSNTTSATSFLYGIGPSWSRETFGPGGNMVQYYVWTL